MKLKALDEWLSCWMLEESLWRRQDSKEREERADAKDLCD